jgi:tRNA threonylcarbamoyladenosine modification (KEOPS) complex  Pcc1 subunit
MRAERVPSMKKTILTRRKSCAFAEITLPKQQGIDYKKALTSQSERAHGRSGTKITSTEKALKITISAEDFTALRASINSIMREMQVLNSMGSLRLNKKRGARHYK